MRPLREIEKLVHGAPIHSEPETNRAVLGGLLEELAACRKEASVPAGRRIWSSMAKVATTAALILIAALVVVSRTSREPVRQPPYVAATLSAADMLTVGRLNAAWRRGGLPEIEQQCELAAQKLDFRPQRISMEQLVREMNGT
jgi:hypothetical protein